MKKFSLFSLLFVSSIAIADTAHIGQVQDHYRDISRQIPSTQTVCHDVQVPIQGQPQADLGGVIIGGVIGNAVGKGIGGEGSRAIGTILGAAVGSQMSAKPTVEGYRIEQRCQNVTSYTTQSERVYSHSTIDFTLQGRNYNIRFSR